NPHAHRVAGTRPPGLTPPCLPLPRPAPKADCPPWTGGGWRTCSSVAPHAALGQEVGQLASAGSGHDRVVAVLVVPRLDLGFETLGSFGACQGLGQRGGEGPAHRP